MSIENVPTVICVAYCPKNTTHFESDIRLLTSFSSQFMIFGDFNAKHRAWNCLSDNKSGKQLYSLQQTNEFMIFNTAEHTHHPHSGQTPSTIDIVLANVSFRFELSTLAGNLLSDHDPVVCLINEKLQHIHEKSFEYKRADWITFRRIVDYETRTLRLPDSCAEIDDAIVQFSNIIRLAQSESIPLKSSYAKSNISPDTKRLIQRKNTIKRQWQRARTEPLKGNLKSDLNRLQKEINSAVKADSKQFWDRQLAGITKSSKKLWYLSKKFRGKLDTHTDRIKINGLHSFDDTDKANCLANVFQESHTLTANHTHENDTIVRTTVNAFNSFSCMQCQTPDITVEEISNIIKMLKPFKSPGPDTIQNILLKNLPSSAIIWLTSVLNCCIRRSHWPSSFKIAKVIPILKAGKNPCDARSFRPISLLNSLGKLLEKVIYNRLIDFIEEKQLLPKHQFGFRRGHSTTQQAMRIKQFIVNNKRLRKSTGVLLLDIEKAFDSIWHDGLIFKLIKMKLPTYLIRIIQAFVRNRHFAVYVNGCSSNVTDIPAGLAQGTCISPILYSLFVADMPTDNEIFTALYADDTALATTAKQSDTIIHRLNKSIESHHEYFNKWRIKVNANKTQPILFPFDNSRRRMPNIALKNGTHIIELSKAVKYLGVTIDTKMNFAEYITNTVDKTTKCFRALYPMLTHNSSLSLSNKTLIYTAVVRPIMTYGSPVWSSAAQTHLKKLSTLQNKVLKTIFNLHRRTPTDFMQQITGICLISEFIENLDSKFKENCRNSDFDLIREIDLM